MRENNGRENKEQSKKASAAAVFDGKDPYGTELQNIKIDFYLNNIMVLSTMISACFPGNFEKDVRCGALVNFQALA